MLGSLIPPSVAGLAAALTSRRQFGPNLGSLNVNLVEWAKKAINITLPPFDTMRPIILTNGISAQSRKMKPLSFPDAITQTLVDVGGGHGCLLTAILQANPTMDGILFDLPHVIEGARADIEASGVADRCTLIAGNAFEEVPTGADAYIMKQMIKDWDDAHCIQLLSNCHQAMKLGGRVLVTEPVLLPGKQMSTIKLIDLQLMVVQSGRERYHHQYRRLFEEAGLRLARIVPTHSPYSILEGVAE